MMRARRGALVLMSLAVTCGSASARPTEEPTTRVTSQEPETVAWRLEAVRAGKTQPATPGETLRTGDGLAMHVSADSPAYVYVMQSLNGRTPRLAFPPSGDRRVSPRVPLRIPDAGQWFWLDDETGQESLFLITSKRSLTLAELGEATSAHAPRQPPQFFDEKPPSPEDASLNPDTRSLWVGTEAELRAHVLHAQIGKRGMAVLKFSFVHKP